MSLKNLLTKNIIITLFIIFQFSCQTPMKPYPHQNRYLVAVLRVENHSKQIISQETLEAVRLQIISELIKYERVRLLERDRIDSILKELKLYQIGLIDGNEALKIGKLLGTDSVLIAEISGIKENLQEVEVPGTKNKNMNLSLNLSCRIIHVSTGEILASALVKENEYANEVNTIQTKVGKIDIDLMIKNGLDKATGKVVKELSSQIPSKP